MSDISFFLALILGAAPVVPTLVKDVRPGPGGSDPRNFVTLDGVLYFTADDGEHGVELWRSDGTEAGTRLVRDIAPGRRSSNPSQPVIVADWLYFTAADDGAGNRELWRSNGTPAATAVVLEIGEGSRGSDPQQLTAAGHRLFFQVEGTLWRNDGPTSTPTPVQEFAALEEMHTLGKHLLFTAAQAGCTPPDYELWVTDGSRRGTSRLRDIVPGCTGSSPSHYVELGSHACFVVQLDPQQASLWVTDGTAAGTRQVENALPTLEAGGIDRFGSRLFFPASVPASGREPYVSDGRSSRLLMDICPGACSSDPYVLQVAGERILFAATSDGKKDTELWLSDGTPAGTMRVKDIQPGPRGSRPLFAALYDSELYFMAADHDTNFELWRSDGTDAGTELVAEIMPGPAGSDPKPLASAGAVLFLAPDDGMHGHELWRIGDPTAKPFAAPPEPEPPSTPAWVIADRANLRDEPAANARLIARLPFGTEVRRGGTQRGWTRISIIDPSDRDGQARLLGWMRDALLNAQALSAASLVELTEAALRAHDRTGALLWLERLGAAARTSPLAAELPALLAGPLAERLHGAAESAGDIPRLESLEAWANARAGLLLGECASENITVYGEYVGRDLADSTRAADELGLMVWFGAAPTPDALTVIAPYPRLVSGESHSEAVAPERGRRAAATARAEPHPEHHLSPRFNCQPGMVASAPLYNVTRSPSATTLRPDVLQAIGGVLAGARAPAVELNDLDTGARHFVEALLTYDEPPLRICALLDSVGTTVMGRLGGYKSPDDWQTCGDPQWLAVGLDKQLLAGFVPTQASPTHDGEWLTLWLIDPSSGSHQYAVPLDLIPAD